MAHVQTTCTIEQTFQPRVTFPYHTNYFAISQHFTVASLMTNNCPPICAIAET